MRRSLFVWLTIMLLVSCTITKRHYRKGFHVDWHHAFKTQAAGTDTLSLLQQADKDPTPEVFSPVGVSPAFSPRGLSPRKTNNAQPQKHVVQPRTGKQKTASVIAHASKKQQAVKAVPVSSDDDYVDEAYALRKANTSMWLGIAAITLFFVFSFFTIILSVIAIKAGRKALLVNSAQQDPKVNRRVRIGIGLARFPIYFLAIALLLAVVFSVIALFIVAGQTLASLGIAFALVFCAGLFLLVYFGLRGYLINPDFRQHERLEKKG